jgi:hypothetical protein
MLPPSRKSNVGNEGKFDFGNKFLKIENVVSISTPFNNQVTEIDHREEVSYIVSEESSEQFTALAFIDFKRRLLRKKCPACRVCLLRSQPSTK